MGLLDPKEKAREEPQEVRPCSTGHHPIPDERLCCRSQSGNPHRLVRRQHRRVLAWSLAWFDLWDHVHHLALLRHSQLLRSPQQWRMVQLRLRAGSWHPVPRMESNVITSAWLKAMKGCDLWERRFLMRRSQPFLFLSNYFGKKKKRLFFEVSQKTVIFFVE